MCDEVEPAVAIAIRATQKQALLGSNEFDSDSEDELTDVVCVTDCPLPPVQGQHLITQLACPFAFRLPRPFHSEACVLLMAQSLLLLAEPGLQLASLGVGVREALLQSPDTVLGFALFLRRRLHATGRRAALLRRTCDCEQPSGGEAVRKDVIERIKEIAAANPEYEHEHRRGSENSGRGVEQAAGGSTSRAIHGQVGIPKHGWG
jgi:hypothetical protein